MKQIFRITDMECPSCAMRLEGLEDDLPGVVRVRASAARQQMEVQYDETRLTPADIVAAIRRLGYTVA